MVSIFVVKNDLEWSDPAAGVVILAYQLTYFPHRLLLKIVTTQGGALRITLSKEEPINNHNLSYRSAMVCLSILCLSYGTDRLFFCA